MKRYDAGIQGEQEAENALTRQGMTLIRKEIKSTYIKSFLYYVPYVTLAAMTFPAILSATANIWSALAGFIIAVFLAYRGKSLLKVSLFACLGVFIVELITGL